MYKITVIENAKELLNIVRPVRESRSDLPSLQKEEVILKVEPDGVFLECTNDKFDISGIAPTDVLREVLNNAGITFSYSTEQKIRT